MLGRLNVVLRHLEAYNPTDGEFLGSRNIRKAWSNYAYKLWKQDRDEILLISLAHVTMASIDYEYIFLTSL